MNIKILLISSIVILFLDFIFLSLIASSFSKIIFNIQKSPLKINYSIAIITYILMILALNYFILNKTKPKLIDAFLLGFIIYGIYETTNLATIQKWSYKLALIDTLWGGILFYLTTYLTCKILNIVK